MRILILGGTRFVGHHLAVSLLERGHQVTVLNRGCTPDELPPEVERLRADRSAGEDLRAAITGRTFDGVVDMIAYEAAHSEAALRIFEGRAGHYVHVSSGQVYLVLEPRPSEPCAEEDAAGRVMSEPPRDTPDHAEWAYGVGKRGCEAVLGDAVERRGFPATVLRLPMVQGERDNYRRLDAYAVRARDGGPVLVPREGGPPLRHVDQTDVVRTIVGLLESGRGKGRIYNLSQDVALALEEFLDLLSGALGTPIRTVALPRRVLEAEGLLPGCSPFSTRWMSVIDNRCARDELGLSFTAPQVYLPRIVAAGVGLDPAAAPGYARRAQELALARSVA